MKEIYEIMKESFPKSEIRTFDDQKKLLKLKEYNVKKVYDAENKNLLGFIAFWDLGHFTFIEHFAVSKNMRGKGVGSKVLKDYLASVKKKVILEVEPPSNDIAKRRIEFYKKLGFHMNSFFYRQPPLQDGCDYIELKLMSYPNKISEEEFLLIKEKIYKTVYKT